MIYRLLLPGHGRPDQRGRNHYCGHERPGQKRLHWRCQQNWTGWYIYAYIKTHCMYAYNKTHAMHPVMVRKDVIFGGVNGTVPVATTLAATHTAILAATHAGTWGISQLATGTNTLQHCMSLNQRACTSCLVLGDPNCTTPMIRIHKQISSHSSLSLYLPFFLFFSLSLYFSWFLCACRRALSRAW